jgi:hypothetical protein
LPGSFYYPIKIGLVAFSVGQGAQQIPSWLPKASIQPRAQQYVDLPQLLHAYYLTKWPTCANVLTTPNLLSLTYCSKLFPKLRCNTGTDLVTSKMGLDGTPLLTRFQIPVYTLS